MGRALFFAALSLLLTPAFLVAQSPLAESDQPQSGAATAANTTLTVRSNLVLVPALVKTKAGELVFSLTASDFTLTDNGVPQPLQLEADTDAQPLALAVIVQTGGNGAAHISDYHDLSAILDSVIGSVPHHIAVISFDSQPRLEQNFSTDLSVAPPPADAAATSSNPAPDDVTAAATTIANLHNGDPGAAILDALHYGIDLLRKQPPAYRRAVMLLSETVDRGSGTSFDDAIRAVDDTNTAIYSFGFSSGKSAVKHQAAELPGSPSSTQPYAPGGCMSRAPNADPDAHGKRSVQALDCASDLLPPIRLARMAFLAARASMQRNVPESVAQLTGGEYFSFKNAKTLREHLVTIANDVPNRYVLSFRPQSPQPGLHALDLKLNGRPQLELKARNAYWVESATSQ